MPYKYAKLTYNYSFKNGALKTGLGFGKLYLPKYYDKDDEREMEFINLPEQVKKIWLFPFYYNAKSAKAWLLLFSADNSIYYSQLVSINPYYMNIDERIEFTSDTNALYYNVDGDDVMLITSATDGMYVFHPSTYRNINTTAPRIISMCRHYERVFAIEEGKRNKLLFSANLDPTSGM